MSRSLDLIRDQTGDVDARLSTLIDRTWDPLSAQDLMAAYADFLRDLGCQYFSISRRPDLDAPRTRLTNLSPDWWRLAEPRLEHGG